MNVNNLNKNLKLAVAVRGYKQQDLAVAMGMSYSFLSECLNGKKNISVAAMIRFSDLLGVSVNWLLSSKLDLSKIDIEAIKEVP